MGNIIFISLKGLLQVAMGLIGVTTPNRGNFSHSSILHVSIASFKMHTCILPDIKENDVFWLLSAFSDMKSN